MKPTRLLSFVMIGIIPAMALTSPLACSLQAQTTQPAGNDRMIWLRADRTYIELFPIDPRWPIQNRDPASAKITYRDGHAGDWVAPSTQPATQPTTLPATKPTAPPATIRVDVGVHPPLVEGPPKPLPPVADVIVRPGQSWVTGVLTATAGQTVYIEAGDYVESWKNQNKRPAKGVTIRGAGIGKTRLIATGGDHLLAWTWSNVTFANVSFVGTEKPSGHGLRLNGCTDLLFVDCEVTRFRMGVCIETAGTKRSKNIAFRGGNYSDNWHPNDGHSHAFYADQVDRLKITGATIARNGHNPASGCVGTGQNHGLYGTGSCGPIEVTDCVIEENSSHGLQARSGGKIERNAFVRNPIHLSYGLVNGAGAIHLGGVSGTIMGNWFERSRLIAGHTPRGYAIEVANISAAGVVIRDNEGFSDEPAPDPFIVPSFAWLRIDKCNLHKDNPHKGKDVGVLNLVVEGNAVTWAGPKVFIAPSISVVGIPAINVAGIRIQTDWPASDGIRGPAK